MNITPINSTNSQPNFNGYVDPKLIKLIKSSANGAIKEELKRGGFSSRIIDADTFDNIRKISTKADEFIEILKNSGIKELHPDTHITYKNIKTKKGPYYKRDVNIILTNPKIKKSLEFGTLINFFNNKHLFQKESQFIPNLLDNDKLLIVFNKFIKFFKESKEKFTPEILKYNELKMFTQFTDGGIIRSLRHKKANKLAPEFGLPSNWTEVLKSARLKEKTEKEAAVKLQEENLRKQIIENEKRAKLFENKNLELVEKYMK